jgi:hypothetical protein
LTLVSWRLFENRMTYRGPSLRNGSFASPTHGWVNRLYHAAGED